MVVLTAALISGCGTGTPYGAEPEGSMAPSLQASEPTPAEAQSGLSVSLEHMRPNEVSLEEFSSGLVRQANQGGAAAQYMTALYSRWGLQARQGAVQWAQADVDGDGTEEVITTFTGIDRGAVLVLYRQGDGFKVDQTEQPGPNLRSVTLYGVKDIAGDGRPEIIWAAADAPISHVFVSTWRPGRFEQMNGEIRVGKLLDLKVEDRALLLRSGVGGAIGSGRPGDIRLRTHRYQLADGAFKLVEQRLDPSPYGIHKLQDGMLAEHFGHLETAALAYREAMEPERLASPLVKGADGATIPSENAQFANAVRATARFRLGLISLRQGRTEEVQQLLRDASGPFSALPGVLAQARDADSACTAAVSWAETDPDFQEAQKSPLGHTWNELAPESLCQTLSYFPAH